MKGGVALGVSVGAEDVFIGGDKEAGGAAGGVEDGLVFLGGEDLDHEVDDVARGAELAGVALGAKDGEQILEGVAEALAVVVAEFVDDLQESLERLRVAVGEVGVLKNVAKEGGDAGIFGHFGDPFAVEAEHLVAAERGGHESGPAVAGVVAGEKFPFAPEVLGLGVHVVHELVDEGDGDLFDLGFGVGNLADKDVAGGVDAAFGIGVEHAGESGDGSGEEVEGGGAANNEGGVDGAVEGDEAGLPRHGEGEQVNVGQVFGGGQARETLGIEQGVVVGPELVTGRGGEFAQQFAGGIGGAGAARVGGGAEDAEEGVFGERAGGPAGGHGVDFEETQGGVTVRMAGIAEGDEDVGVEQEHQRVSWRGRAKLMARSSSS